MRYEPSDDVRVVFDCEVESPGAICARLPDILRFVVLFCPKRGMVKILEEQPGLLVERPPHAGCAVLF